MTSIAVTPWTERFLPLLDKAEIFRRTLHGPTSLSDLEALPVDTACLILARELEQVFYPTTQMVDVLHRQVEIALAHSLLIYPDPRSYLEGIYSRLPPLPAFGSVRCVTGLAGIGKSSFLKALQRLLPPGEPRVVPSDAAPSPTATLWAMNIQVQSSLRDLFGTFGGPDGVLKDRIDTMRKRAYRDGISLIVADEFQFLTSSSAAHTRLAQTLLSLGYCGLPACYVANYSLLHRLLRRPQEDRDRLLCDFTILTPDLPESEDWMHTLTFQIGVVPDAFRINPATEGAQVHRLCAGLKRTLADLLVLAYRVARLGTRPGERAAVRLKDLQTAYESEQFASHRIDVEIITQQTILNRPIDKRRTDLWCPINAGASAHSELRKALIRQRDVALTHWIQEAAATRRERKALNSIVQATSADTSGKVVKLPRSPRPSSAELKANAQRLMDDRFNPLPE